MKKEERVPGPVVDEALIDRLMDQVDAEGLEVLLTKLSREIMSRGIEGEMSEHLVYDKGDPAGWSSGNNRNCSYDKKVHTDAGSVPVEMPRDRVSSFEPKLIPKHQRRLSGLQRPGDRPCRSGPEDTSPSTTPSEDPRASLI